MESYVDFPIEVKVVLRILEQEKDLYWDEYIKHGWIAS